VGWERRGNSTTLFVTSKFQRSYTTRNLRRGHTSPPTPASPRATNTAHEPTPSLGEAGASLKQPPTLQCVGGGGEHATTAQTTTPFTGSYNQKPSPRPHITADPRLPQSSQYCPRTNAITGGGGGVPQTAPDPPMRRGRWGTRHNITNDNTVHRLVQPETFAAVIHHRRPPPPPEQPTPQTNQRHHWGRGGVPQTAPDPPMRRGRWGKSHHNSINDNTVHRLVQPETFAAAIHHRQPPPPPERPILPTNQRHHWGRRGRPLNSPRPSNA